MKNIFQGLFIWYKKNYKINLYLVAFLFIWQLAHLYWLSADVVFLRLYGFELWGVGRIGNIIISLIDYTEIPALILGSVFYINEFKKALSVYLKWKSILFLVFLNSQWLHLFWITDEVVVAQFTGVATMALPIWLSWTAIMIDYLELPVIYDTIKKAILSLKTKKVA